MSQSDTKDFEQPESNKVSKKYLTEKKVADFFSSQSSPVLSKKDNKSNIRKPFQSKKVDETILITYSETDGNGTDDDKGALQSRLEWFHSKNIVETIVISRDEE